MKEIDPETLSENERLKTCEKNPGHTKFIPVNTFSINHLPIPYRSSEVFESIRTLATLTVRITVKRKVATYYGTGTICQVDNYASKHKCKCFQCQDSDNDFKGIWYVYIITAAHLITHDQEASNIRADAFYDNQFEKEKIRTFHGHRIVERCDECDICTVMFITHDQDLGEELTQHVQQYRHFKSSGHDFKMGERIAIIVSHPHGSSKKISIGSVTSTSSIKAFTGKFEAQIVNVEVEVHYPDGECSKKMIWMLDRKVKETKEFLLKEAGIKDGPEQWSLQLCYADGSTASMDDNMIIRDYIDQLTEIIGVHFVAKD